MEKIIPEASYDFEECTIHLLKTDEKLTLEIQNKLNPDLFSIEVHDNVQEITNKKFKDINELYDGLNNALNKKDPLVDIIFLSDGVIGFSSREKISSPLKIIFKWELSKQDPKNVNVLSKQVSRLLLEKNSLEKRVKELEEIIHPKFQPFTSLFDKDNYASKWYTVSDDGKKAIRNSEDPNLLKILPVLHPIPSAGKHEISFKIINRSMVQHPPSLYLGVGTSVLFEEKPEGKRNFYSLGCSSGILSRNGPLYGGGFAILIGRILNIKIDSDNKVVFFESEGYRIHTVKIDDFEFTNNFIPYMVSGVENDEVEIL